MKPIEQNIIDFADDFFFRLSDNEVQEKMLEFRNRQSELHNLILTSYIDLSGSVPIIFLCRLTLVIDYCFSSYHVKLDTIKRETVSNYLDWKIKTLTEVHSITNLDNLNFSDYVNALG